MSFKRVGTGWDVHKLVENRPLILGGIEIENDKLKEIARANARAIYDTYK